MGIYLRFIPIESLLYPNCIYVDTLSHVHSMYTYIPMYIYIYYIHTHIIQFSCIFWWLSGKNQYSSCLQVPNLGCPEQMAWHEELLQVAASGTSNKWVPIEILRWQLSDTPCTELLTGDGLNCGVEWLNTSQVLWFLCLIVLSPCINGEPTPGEARGEQWLHQSTPLRWGIGGTGGYVAEKMCDFYWFLWFLSLDSSPLV